MTRHQCREQAALRLQSPVASGAGVGNRTRSSRHLLPKGWHHHLHEHLALGTVVPANRIGSAADIRLSFMFLLLMLCLRARTKGARCRSLLPPMTAAAVAACQLDLFVCMHTDSNTGAKGREMLGTIARCFPTWEDRSIDGYATHGRQAGRFF